MVRAGNHSVCLVDAKTDLPLKEFQHQGKTWVVGQPGQEYWISVTSYEYNNFSVARARVDGKRTGSRVKHDPRFRGESRYMGIFRGGHLKAALCFASRSHEGQRDNSKKNVGMIDVSWHEVRNTGRQDPQELGYRYYGVWKDGETAGVEDGKKEGVGALQSKVGSTMERKEVSRSLTGIGRCLYGAKIYYCEAAGLVARGIVTHQQLVAQGIVGGGNEPQEEDIKPTPERRKQSHKKPQAVAETIDLTDDAEVSSAGDASPPVVPDQARSSSVVKVEAVQSSTLHVEDVLN